MSEYFLLRGQKTMLREVVAGWLSLGGGALLFGLVSARYSSSMGADAAYVAGFVISAPCAIGLLQAIRGQRLRMATISFPKGKPWSDFQREEQGSRSRRFWESLAPDEREGLRWLTGMAAANLVSPDLLEEEKRERTGADEEAQSEKIELEPMPTQVGPDKFIFNVKNDPTKVVVMKVDRRRHTIFCAVQMVRPG